MYGYMSSRCAKADHLPKRQKDTKKNIIIYIQCPFSRLSPVRNRTVLLVPEGDEIIDYRTRTVMISCDRFMALRH